MDYSLEKQIDRKHTVYGLDFTRSEIQQAILNNRLLSIDIEFSRKCNLKCIYCYANSGNPQPNELDYYELKDIIDHAVQLGVKRFCLIGGGEPLLYPDLFKVIDYINRYDLPKIMFTNGALLNYNIAKKLYKLKTSIVVKLSSLSSDIHDLMCGNIHGAHKKAMAALYNLMKIGYPTDGLQVGIQSVITNYNIKQLPSLWLWARKRNIIPYFETITYQGRAKSNGIYVDVNKVKNLFEELYHIDMSKYGIEWIVKPPIAAMTCQRNYYSCYITSTGDVYPCAGITENIGNVREKELASILSESEVIHKLRNLHEYQTGYCNICEYKDFCYGCKGNAFQMLGSYLESDPFCWHAKQNEL